MLRSRVAVSALSGVEQNKQEGARSMLAGHVTAEVACIAR